MNQGRDRNSAQTVEKAMSVLQVVGAADGPMTIADIIAVSRFSATAVRRIVRALEKVGALSRADGSAVQIGWMIRGLSHGREWHDDLKQCAMPIMVRLHQACSGETVGLYVPVNTSEFMCIETIAGRHGLIHLERLYQPLPMSRGATSRVFLVQRLRWFGEPALRTFLRESLIDVESPAAVEATVREVRRARRRGYAVSRSTRFAGMTGLSVPVSSGRQQTLAALTISGASERFRGDSIPQWAQRARTAAEQICSAFRPGTSQA